MLSMDFCLFRQWRKNQMAPRFIQKLIFRY